MKVKVKTHSLNTLEFVKSAYNFLKFHEIRLHYYIVIEINPVFQYSKNMNILIKSMLQKIFSSRQFLQTSMGC